MRNSSALYCSIFFLTLCLSLNSIADTTSHTPDISAFIGVETWIPSSDLDTYWNPHQVGGAVELTVEYSPRIDMVITLSEQEFEPSYIDDNLMVPDLLMLLMRGGIRGEFMQRKSVAGFLEGGLLWAVTSFSSDEMTFPGHSARESEGGVYLGGGVGISFLKSWSLQLTCRGHRVFTNPDEMNWTSFGIGLRKTWSEVAIFRGVW